MKKKKKVPLVDFVGGGGNLLKIKVLVTAAAQLEEAKRVKDGMACTVGALLCRATCLTVLGSKPHFRSLS